MGKTLGQRRRRFRRLNDLSKKERTATLAPIPLPSERPLIRAELVMSRRLGEAFFTEPGQAATRTYADIETVRMLSPGPNLVEGELHARLQAQMRAANEAMFVPAAMLGDGLTNAAPQAQTALTVEMIRQSVAQLQERGQLMGIGFAGPIREPPPMPLVALGHMRDLLLPGLRMMVGQYAGMPDMFPSYPRIDPETVARSRERARGLLKSLLTPEQWAEFEHAGAVTEQIDGCEFKLRPGGMIEATKPRLVGPFHVERWCVYPDPFADKNEFMPDEDKLIGQLLHLRAGPDQLRRQANVFPVQ